MRRFLSTLLAVLLGLVFLIFAVANRHSVNVSFDPFNSARPAVFVSMPLFALIIAVAILGVIAGGFATWVGQRHWRRAARQHEAEARTARAQLAEVRADALAARHEAPRAAPPPRIGFYGPSGRDKQGASL